MSEKQLLAAAANMVSNSTMVRLDAACDCGAAVSEPRVRAALEMSRPVRCLPPHSLTNHSRLDILSHRSFLVYDHLTPFA